MLFKFLRHQPINFGNLSSVPRRREHFRFFWAIFLVPNCFKKKCFSIQEFTFQVPHLKSNQTNPLSILGYDQQNLKNFLSDFKWSGHRLAHVFADGWSTVPHKRKMTLLEAPTRTLLFYYKEIQQELAHTLLLGECGVRRSG